MVSGTLASKPDLKRARPQSQAKRGAPFTKYIQLSPTLTDFKRPTIVIGYRWISVIANIEGVLVPKTTGIVLPRASLVPNRLYLILPPY